MVASIRPHVTPLSTGWLGVAAWLVALVAISAPLQERILLLAPLVIVPMLVGALPDRPVVEGVTTGVLAGQPMLIAALLLVVAAALPRGPMAAVTTLPWLGVAMILAAGGIRHGLRELPDLLAPRRGGDLATDAAFVALLVGAAALTADRLDVDFVTFSDVIRTLTAVHFHFAAFGLVGLAALTARARPGVLPWIATVGLLVGIACTALGFMSWSEAGWAGAVLVGASGLLEAALIAGLLRSTLGWPAAAGWSAVAALSVGMVLAVAWPTSLVVAPGLLDIDSMVRTHGILNAFAVTVLALTAPAWARSGATR